MVCREEARLSIEMCSGPGEFPDMLHTVWPEAFHLTARMLHYTPLHGGVDDIIELQCKVVDGLCVPCRSSGLNTLPYHHARSTTPGPPRQGGHHTLKRREADPNSAKNCGALARST